MRAELAALESCLFAARGLLLLLAVQLAGVGNTQPRTSRQVCAHQIVYISIPCLDYLEVALVQNMDSIGVIAHGPTCLLAPRQSNVWSSSPALWASSSMWKVVRKIFFWKPVPNSQGCGNPMESGTAAWQVWPALTSLLCHLLTLFGLLRPIAATSFANTHSPDPCTLSLVKLPGNMNLGQGQDWDTVVIRKKAPSGAGAAKDKSAVAAAVRSGAEVESVKKFAAGSNRAATGAPKDAAKLDRETEELHHERCAVSSSQGGYCEQGGCSISCDRLSGRCVARVAMHTASMGSARLRDVQPQIVKFARSQRGRSAMFPGVLWLRCWEHVPLET